MLTKNNQFTFLKRELGAAILKLYKNGNLEKEIDALPVKMIPRTQEHLRCCIHKDRAMIRSRLIALMGFDPQKDDEITPLHTYAHKAVVNKGQNQTILTTIPSGCSACSASHYQVTDLCKGCLARPCMTNCPKGAIKIEHGKAVIDKKLCINCGKCQQVCPFTAITHVSVPCEEACPVGAIIKNEFGEAVIIQEKCIECGACSRACPFGAITECSQIIETAEKLTSTDHVTAIIAPSIEGQFPGTLSQIVTSLHILGFDHVIEAAQGAITTVESESAEIKKLAKDTFLTSSCCPAYTACVDKHIPALKSHVSKTRTPLSYAAESAKIKNPETFTVFIGPCIAKKREGINDPFIDAVITFEELAAFFIAWDVDVHAQEEAEQLEDISQRQFAVSGGVTRSVDAVLKADEKVSSMQINGMDKKVVRLMKTWEKRAPGSQFVEVMCCEEGCIGGPACISDPRLVKKRASYITA
jgi:[FeFe] hydrogenase (group B1/B3)